MPDTKEKEWLSASEYAEHVGLKKGTVYKMFRHGRLPRAERMPNNRVVIHRDTPILKGQVGRPVATTSIARANPEGKGSKMLEETLSIPEVAEREGVSPQRVYKWLQKERIIGAEKRSWGWYIPPDYTIIRYQWGSGLPIEESA